MSKITNFFKKLVGRAEEPDLELDVEVYQAEDRLEHLEYNGTIEEDVLKGIRDKPYRSRRLSSCAPTITSIRELGNMEAMCEQLDEEPDAAVDKFSTSQRQEYKKRLSRRFSRKLSSVGLNSNGISNQNNGISNNISSSSLHQSNNNTSAEQNRSNQNLQNIYKVPSGLETRNSSSHPNNRVSQRFSTNSRISTTSTNRVSYYNSNSQLQSRTNSTINNNNNLINNGNNMSSNNYRKGSIFHNRRISIYSIDSIAGCNLPGNTILTSQNRTSQTQNNQTTQNLANQNTQQQHPGPNPFTSMSRASTNSNTRGTKISESVSKNPETNIIETDEEIDDFPARFSLSKRRSSNASKIYHNRNSQSNQHVSGHIKMLEGENPFENQII